MCLILKVSRSGFYAWCNRKESRRKREDKKLLQRIKSIFYDSRETYGCVRIVKELIKMRIKVGKNRVSRLMRENGLRAKAIRRIKRTTHSNHSRSVAPNVVNKDFSVHAVNRLWTSDITYVWTQEGWLYLTVILDAFSRCIVGWSMSNRMRDQLVIDALMAALWRRKPPEGVIFHSDRGSQYCSNAFRKLLKKHNIYQSMSSVGNCFDNAITETFFHTLKTECVYHNFYKTRNEARKSIFDYIEIFYNRKRIHSALEYKSPIDFELLQKVA